MDVLTLTATPIPRSLALALFGNLTLSYLKHRPHDAAQRATFVHQKADRGHAYDAARTALARGEQVYVVCPLIGQDSGERDAKAADGGSGGRRREADEEAYEGTVFADYRVELLHGRMPASEKQAVMQRFRDNETQVLVATTVIEVGVDVPNATVMIVEDADRFGLSQLHQLRGRVGRGEKAAEMHLVSASKSDAALTRLSAMVDTDDGFELASYDLSLRREGDILGNRQHGASGLKLVNVMRDGAVIEAAHADAAAILEEDPNLELPAHRALAREVRIVYANDHVAQGG